MVKKALKIKSGAKYQNGELLWLELFDGRKIQVKVENNGFKIPMGFGDIHAYRVQETETDRIRVLVPETDLSVA